MERLPEMNLGLLFALLLKATLLSFSGFGSLPVLREDLVTNRKVLTDDELNQAVAVARVTPGPMGSYVVAIGYAVAGWPGAAIGWAAMSAPALCVLPLVLVLRRYEHSAVWRSSIEAVILASAALVLATATELMPTAVVNVSMAFVAVVALIVVLFTRVSSIWVIAAGSLVALLLP